jgi:hypothetical protein
MLQATIFHDEFAGFRSEFISNICSILPEFCWSCFVYFDARYAKNRFQNRATSLSDSLSATQIFPFVYGRRCHLTPFKKVDAIATHRLLSGMASTVIRYGNRPFFKWQRPHTKGKFASTTADLLFK